MDRIVSGNMAQLPKMLLNAKYMVSVEGRGTGKSYDIGFMMARIIQDMPRSVTTLTGKSYGQLLTRTLPSSFKLLNSLGQVKDVTYVIGKKPPSHFRQPYEAINKYDNIITFLNGTTFAMISQSEAGSGRGANSDFEIVDEALLLDREQYNNEVAPTNRGNNDRFGKKSPHPVPYHHGFKYCSSMPTNKEGRWLLEYGEYYQKERGVKLFSEWNRIVSLQVALLEVVRAYRQAKAGGTEAQAKEAIDEYRAQWAEIARLRRRIVPFVSSEGVLFTLSNAFDNLDMLGMDYLLSNQNKLPYLIFMTEIMNMYYDKVEDCFYSLKESKHVYYNSFDNARVQEEAIRSNYSLSADGYESSEFDRDCNPTAPLEVCFDWGSSICLMVVHQETHWDFVENCASEQVCQTQINEFFVKPDKLDGMMIPDLIHKFTSYYAKHGNKMLYFYMDRYGDHKNPNVRNNETFNDMAIRELEAAGWNVIRRKHPGMEPPQSDKYNLWGRILSEISPTLPKFRINGNRCRFTLISMNNTKVKTVDKEFKKDKSSERASSGVPPEEATHFGDAVDKLIWTKYSGEITQRHTGGEYVRWNRRE